MAQKGVGFWPSSLAEFCRYLNHPYLGSETRVSPVGVSYIYDTYLLSFMQHIFGYARVSTADQNLDTQLEVLRQIGCHEIFQDRITGVATSRPGLDQLLVKLRHGDVVVVARFNRLGRDRNHMISLLGEFAQQGIHFRALDLGVDSSTPAGKMVLQIFAALAEYDRETIREKTRAGIELAKAQGKHMGRPAGVDAEKFEKVKRAFEKGLSARDTAELTNISLSSVKRYRRSIEATSSVV